MLLAMPAFPYGTNVVVSRLAASRACPSSVHEGRAGEQVAGVSVADRDHQHVAVDRRLVEPVRVGP